MLFFPYLVLQREVQSKLAMNRGDELYFKSKLLVSSLFGIKISLYSPVTSIVVDYTLGLIGLVFSFFSLLLWPIAYAGRRKGRRAGGLCLGGAGCLSGCVIEPNEKVD